MSTSGVEYPVRFEVDYPQSSSRLLALSGVLLFKGLLLLPHIVVLMFLGIASLIATYIGYWAVLIAGQYPRGLFNFVAGVQRWTTRTDAWVNGLTDRYPPFTLGEADYPARFEVDYPESSSRLLGLLGAALFIKGLLLIPHAVILYVLGLASYVVAYIGYWVVLITGQYPGGLFSLVAGVQRWEYRANSWSAGLTDRYPPFSLSQ